MSALLLIFLWPFLLFAPTRPTCPPEDHNYVAYAYVTIDGKRIDGVEKDGKWTFKTPSVDDLYSSTSVMLLGTTTIGWRQATDTPEQEAHNKRVEECRTANGQF